MPENKCGFQGNIGKETVCLDVNRILDSCRDKDCFENVRVHLTDCSAELLDRISQVRPISAEIVGATVFVDPVAFNRGFYQITVRFFVRVQVEGCVGARPQTLEGIAVCEKRAILYGGEGSVHVFRSAVRQVNPCVETPAEMTDRMPSVVCEVVDPVLLDAKVIESCKIGDLPGGCGCGCVDIPESVLCCLSSCLCGRVCEKLLTVSLGFFSVLRIERSCQYLVCGTEYSVPDKVCAIAQGEDPCKMFARMSFPVSEFSCCPKNDGACKS